MTTINDVDTAQQQATTIAHEFLREKGWEPVAGTGNDLTWGKSYKGLYLTGNTEFAVQLERHMNS